MITFLSCEQDAIVLVGNPTLGAQATSRTQSLCPTSDFGRVASGFKVCLSNLTTINEFTRKQKNKQTTQRQYLTSSFHHPIHLSIHSQFTLHSLSIHSPFTLHSLSMHTPHSLSHSYVQVLTSLSQPPDTNRIFISVCAPCIPELEEGTAGHQETALQPTG
eukprot:TRINITY_DN80_c0_g1_i7.p1 TRINITY_DN80_c0_g1~~TRINITY_DN80_c0_g1_i7.p1  ORF type:complete len:161 (-),score=15.05 TRINITY_DN80_c0_g1_i7:700-1182(-)